MRSKVLFLVILITLVLTTKTFAEVGNSASSQKIVWQDYSAAVFDQAKKTHHLLLLYFKSKSCHWCQEMDKTTWQTPSIINEINAKFLPVLIDVEAHFDIVEQYHLTSIPDIFIYDANNHIYKFLTGYVPPETIAKYLSEVGKTIPTVLPQQNPSYKAANDPVHVVIVGSKQDPQARKLYLMAFAHSGIHSKIEWWDPKEGPLPNSDVAYPAKDKPVAYVCRNLQCSFPIETADNLIKILSENSTNTQPKALNQPHEVNTPPNITNAEKLLAGRNWFFIIVGFIGVGLLLSFTPCVLPLIPIMASIIVGQTIGVRKEKTFLLCLTYVLSMSLTYAVVGLLAGVFGLYLQVYMQATWIIVLFSLLFLILSLSMLGLFELRLPRIFHGKVIERSNAQKGGTYLGVMGMGILATLIISPCVTAPLAGVLSFIAKTGNYLLGGVGLFFMSMGMGVPLLIISLFSKNILPKAAEWNDQIKNFFGLILLGTAIWLISRVISNSYTMILWSAFFILLTVYMGITQKKTKHLYNKLWKTLTYMLFIYGVFLFVNVLFFNSQLYSQQGLNQKLSNTTPNVDSNLTFKNINNETDLVAAIEEAKLKHVPLLVDFTAKWCSACAAMDRDVLSESNVKALLKEFALFRVDLTNTTNDSMALARHYNVVGPPVFLFFNENGQLMNARVTGEMEVKTFIEILQNVLR